MSILLRRRGLLMQQNKSLLPNTYQQVKYIESTGTQYIDTGIVPVSTISITTKVQFTVNYADAAFMQAMNGCASDSANTRCVFGYTSFSSDKNFYIGISDKNIFTEVPFDTKIHTIAINMNGEWSIDGVTKKQIVQTSQANETFWLFARNYSTNQDSFNNPCSMRLYNFKAYDNGTLIRDFIPCYRKHDGVIGLYDIVNDVFYTNQRTGTFIKGGDV